MNRRSFLKYCAAGIAAASVPLSLAGAKAKAVAGGIPYITLLQDLSPKVGYPGIAAGMLLNTQTGKAYSDIEFVPCYTRHVFVEWKNRNKGGKLVAEHRWDSDIVKRAKAKSSQFLHYVTDDGHDLVETFHLYGLMVDGDKVVTRCVLGFTGAKIKVYKNFLQVVMAAGGARYPLFAYKLRISSIREQWVRGTKTVEFYNYWITPAKGSWRWKWDWADGVPKEADQRLDVEDTLTPPNHPFIKAGSEFANQLRESL